MLARPSSINGSRPTPTPKSSGDYISASSTSSYAHSIASSSFTLLSNTTDNLSASSAFFDHKPNTDNPSNNAFAVQLKKLYRCITSLETKILNEEIDEGGPEESRILLKERGKDLLDEDVEVQKWNKLIRDHKR